MPRIVDDPNRAICPSFEDPEWEFLRQSVVNAHQGDQPLTLDEAAQQMKDAWALENQRKIAAWNDQALQDQATQDELGRVAHEEEEAQRALQEKEEENLRKEADKKRPKLEPYDSGRRVEKWIQPRPSSYALNKISSLEYVELDYFTPKACREAAADPNKSVGQDTLAFTQIGDTFAIRPLAAVRPSKLIRNDEELSWEDMLDAKNAMLDFMAKSGVWPDAHAASIATFFFNLEHHQRKGQKNGKMALLLYQSRVRREWFDALKRGQGFNIELIEEELLRSCAEEVNETVRDRENAARDREFDQVRDVDDLRREPELTIPFILCLVSTSPLIACPHSLAPNPLPFSVAFLPCLLLPPSITHPTIGCRALSFSTFLHAVRCFFALPFQLYRCLPSRCSLPPLFAELPFTPTAVCRSAVNPTAACRLASSAPCNAPATNCCSRCAMNWTHLPDA